MKIKIITLLSFCALVTVGILIFVWSNPTEEEHANAKNSVEPIIDTGNLEVDKTIKELNDTNVLGSITDELKQKGYASVGIVMYSVHEDEKQNEITIPISKTEYKNEQTEQEIESITNDVLKKHGFSPFKIKVETK